jgi:hypothetical protein
MEVIICQSNSCKDNICEKQVSRDEGEVKETSRSVWHMRLHVILAIQTCYIHVLVTF